MPLVDIIGTIACVITTIYTSLGLPVQIYKNHQGKSTEGLSLSMMIMSFCTFSSWVAYGFIKAKPDWYVIISNAPGSICIALILLQFRLYRKKA